MRIWYVSVVLAAVVMLSVGQLVWAQAATKPAEGDRAADVQEPAGKDVGKADEKTDQAGKPATKPADDKSSPFSDMRLIIVMVAVMALLWWWMGRGRRKEQQRHKEMLSTLKKGDKVTSIGGIIGTVVEVKDKEVVVKVDESSNVRMKFLRSAIRNVGGIGRGEDSADDSKK